MSTEPLKFNVAIKKKSKQKRITLQKLNKENYPPEDSQFAPEKLPSQLESSFPSAPFFTDFAVKLPGCNPFRAPFWSVMNSMGSET